jgi:hypothetical protein
LNSVGSEQTESDPQCLFQGLITAEALAMLKDFRHELCSYHPPMFNCNQGMLKADKASLANAM